MTDMVISAATSPASRGWHSLPTEMRLEIYRQCWEPRKIQFRCRHEEKEKKALGRKLPITLAIDRESRWETLRHYKRWSLKYNFKRKLNDKNHPGGMRRVKHGYINPKIDSIEIHDTQLYATRRFLLTGLVLDPTILASLDVTVTGYEWAVREVTDSVNIFDTPENRGAVRRIRVIIKLSGQYQSRSRRTWETKEFSIDLSAQSLENDMLVKSTL
ncbi:hypothetical protein QBC40DRAFT_300041 [Triangularia verruculosa]|uniref:2EXR domain-containing protein n=1 Tax=Triangularia verruculosa TaxID=2587418 RepID=A0AAN6XBR0_9PEZI|nr:hypothetical protein QBC40DRAFT_300041 [Triangularia verruculosa]